MAVRDVQFVGGTRNDCWMPDPGRPVWKVQLARTPRLNPTPIEYDNGPLVEVYERYEYPDTHRVVYMLTGIQGGYPGGSLDYLAAIGLAYERALTEEERNG